MRQPEFPPGWDEERVRKVLAHYEDQSEEEAAAEDEAAFEDPKQTVMLTPTSSSSISEARHDVAGSVARR